MHFPSRSADLYSVNLIQLITGLSVSEGAYTEGPNSSAACHKHWSRPSMNMWARLLTAPPPASQFPSKANPGMGGRKEPCGHCSVPLEEDASSTRMEWHTEGLLSFSAVGWCDGAHVWGGMMGCTSGEVWWNAHPGMRPAEGSAQPDSASSAFITFCRLLVTCC